MAQNIYDDPGFFERYRQLGRSREGLAGAAEWPALRALLPDLNNLAVVDLGCGFGWFARFAAEQGAARILGIDLSENMLARARAATPQAAVAYQRANLETLTLPAASFHLAYSSLALHYVEDLGALFTKIHNSLVPGGRLVFSIEHPIFMASRHPGWRTDAEGRRFWPVDSYGDEGPRVTHWLTEGVVKQHRTLGTILNLLIGAGFAIAHVEDFAPTKAQIAARPELAEERERPMFLLVAARRGAAIGR